MKGDPLGKMFFTRNKSVTMPKKQKGDTLVSPGIVCYAEKKEKPFWFVSLDRIVQFDTIKFRRTL